MTQIKTLVTLFLIILSLFLIPYAMPPVLAQEKSVTEAQEQDEEQALDDDLDQESELQKPQIEGRFQFKQIGQVVNEDTRINPENETWDLKESHRTINIYAQISDYFDDEETVRWLFKGYGYSKYESGQENSQDDDLLRIDELYLDGAFGNWFVNVGKRRITWGTTSVFNPVNVVVPPRNPLVPDPQTEGHPMLLVNYGGDLINFDLILTKTYDRDWYGQYQRWGARLNLLFDDFDIGLYYFDGEPYANNSRYSRMAAVSYSSNFLQDATLYVELASFSENYRFYFNDNGVPEVKDERIFRGAIGSVITLDGSASILVEVFHNGSSYTRKEREFYFNAVDTNLSVIRSESLLNDYQKWVLGQYQIWQMNQNYLLLTYSKSFWEKYSTSFNVIVAEDSSAITTASGSYSISDYYLLDASLRDYSGDENSEFGNYYVSSVLTLSLSSSF
ncbi:MAG: hypothetical protein HN580_20730 [Deltaproteobacteria bacterium]|jgi:hypothetical protein|nr:hypothetical protein [Deltaproteobacteria bacterium]MBT4088023.1 hypothetical protein [Deltaproteobacteria bacterium]MBT4263534.1 hypothetical protein [Deltaproteobacteria bacterium]MBT4637836.1 hypothetical protein [Deltaproteobacteria bacterium]MBT6500140.1 hypothetical protein [Deltaproteobacteria bacterium]